MQWNNLSIVLSLDLRLFGDRQLISRVIIATRRKTALVYYCHTCQSPHWQPFGRVQERVSEKNGNVNLTYHVPAGPPEQVKGDRCSECGGKFHVRSRRESSGSLIGILRRPQKGAES